MTDAMEPIDWTGSALQGGGSHGAFTWGVLDYLLEDSRLDIEAITGTSAGAMNAVVLAEGYLEGARGRAKKSRQILAID
jgi:NTE family protein